MPGKSEKEKRAEKLPCSDSTSGTHEFELDVEYDAHHPPLVCWHCGLNVDQVLSEEVIVDRGTRVAIVACSPALRVVVQPDGAATVYVQPGEGENRRAIRVELNNDERYKLWAALSRGPRKT